MDCDCKSTEQASIRTRAAMCQTCPRAVRASIGVIGCSINGLDIAELVYAEEPQCPKGKHDPEPRWFGIRWRGVPMPLRIWLWAFNKKHSKIDSFDGCGCIDRLKEFYELVTIEYTHREELTNG